MAEPTVRKGQTDVKLSRQEWERRFRENFYDPNFDALKDEIDRIVEVAWLNYDAYRKNPRTVKAGEGFANPAANLPTEWMESRRRVVEAQRAHEDGTAQSRVLIVCASARTDQTCPGEMSKTFRLVQLAREEVARAGYDADVLDLSDLTAEYGRRILPCKGCVSTAMPLCHWPCSCYPNYAIGQINDAMADIYPRWVAAHGVIIVTPVYWYQAPSVLKLMIDRLVCADGGNPDPTTTGMKDPQKAKALELRGWPYPKHLAGRIFSVVVHGDVTGAETLRRVLVDWLTDLQLIPALGASVDGYIGYYEPYATSHDALDGDEAIQQEVRNAARLLCETVRLARAGQLLLPEQKDEPRPK